MLANPGHVFSHQQQYPTTDWSHMPQQQQQSQNSQSHHNRETHAQAAAAAAQQQHYNRLAGGSTTGEHSFNGSDTSLGTLSTMGTGNSGGSLSSGGNGVGTQEERKVLDGIAQLMNPATREAALLELSKKREQFPQLAMILWHSFGGSPVLYRGRARLLMVLGCMTSLLQEIISVYPLLNPSQLTAAASNRICNALALLQCVASHVETRGLFLNGEIKVLRPDPSHLT